MNSQAAGQVVSSKTKPARKPEDDRREECPFIPITKRPVQRLSPSDGTSERSTRIVHLRGKKPAKSTRNDQDDAPGRQRPFWGRRCAHNQAPACPRDNRDNCS